MFVWRSVSLLLSLSHFRPFSILAPGCISSDLLTALPRPFFPCSLISGSSLVCFRNSVAAILLISVLFLQNKRENTHTYIYTHSHFSLFLLVYFSLLLVFLSLSSISSPSLFFYAKAPKYLFFSFVSLSVSFQFLYFFSTPCFPFSAFYCPSICVTVSKGKANTHIYEFISLNCFCSITHIFLFATLLPSISFPSPFSVKTHTNIRFLSYLCSVSFSFPILYTLPFLVLSPFRLCSLKLDNQKYTHSSFIL